MCVNFTNLN
jgi:hypothetical protein